ncbi:MAG: alpha/beta hydrolase [Defluviitaleaceae bacterium]|nr:alpha/beta hydrolase [Defluviitaleaceae bacterium]
MRLAIIIIVSVIVFIFLCVALSSYLMFRAYFTRRKREKDYVSGGYQEPWKSIIDLRNAEKDWFFGLPCETLRIKSGGFELNGYYLSQKSPLTAILIHGYNDDSRSRMPDARLYHDMGYNVFIPDVRSHGKSQGKYVGMGCVDRRDILRWIDLLRSKEAGPCKFVLDGVSMGGATVLALSGDPDLPESVCAIVSDCAFTSVKELLPTLSRLKPRFLTAWLVAALGVWSRMLARYGYSEATPEQMIQKAKVPVLIIHGAKDEFVPFVMSKRLYELCSSENKEYWAAETAGHATSSWYEREGYQERIREFLGKYAK